MVFGRVGVSGSGFLFVPFLTPNLVSEKAEPNKSYHIIIRLTNNAIFVYTFFDAMHGVASVRFRDFTL